MWWVVDIVLCVVVDLGVCLLFGWMVGLGFVCAWCCSWCGGYLAVACVIVLFGGISCSAFVAYCGAGVLCVLQFGALLFRIGCYFVYSVGVAKFALVAGGWYMCWGLFLDCLVCFGW